MENHNLSLMSLGVVAVMAVVGLVLMFSQAQTTALGVYGGALQGEQYPYLEGRQVGGPIGEGASPEFGNEAQAWQTGTPYRTYSRAPTQIPSQFTGCGPTERELGADLAHKQMLRYDIKCRRMETIPGQLVAFCCPIPNYAEGRAQQVRQQSWYT